jgi:glucose/arabinose dehydrogenase
LSFPTITPTMNGVDGLEDATVGVTRRSTIRGLALAGLVGTAASGQAHAGHGGGDEQADPAVGLELVASGFESPVDYLQAPEERDRAFVPDQPGLIHVVDGDGRRPEPFLDVREQVFTGGNEAGLLGLAFHPDFAENRRFYVRYSAPARDGTPDSYSHTFVLSEFTADDGETVDPESERTLLEIPEPQANHNAGDVDFGPDGYLYVTVGDGGAANDQGAGHVEDWYDAVGGGNGQDVTENLLGSVLRIDVDDRSGDEPYGIPDDNPLVGQAGLEEHYAWGLRNPWRMSFDEETDRLFVGDVGQNTWEEVNIVEKGGNYGWNVREGAHCFQAEDCPGETPEGEALVDPILEYPNQGGKSDADITGISVTGGHVYRGDAISSLRGQYVFGDLTGQLLLGKETDEGSDWTLDRLTLAEGEAEKLPNLIAIGRDRAGELYVTTRGHDNGAVYRLVPGGDGQTTAGGMDDTAPETDDDTDRSAERRQRTDTAAPGLGSIAGLTGLAAGVGLARWLRRE